MYTLFCIISFFFFFFNQKTLSDFYFFAVSDDDLLQTDLDSGNDLYERMTNWKVECWHFYIPFAMMLMIRMI